MKLKLLIPAWTTLDRSSVLALLTHNLNVPDAIHVAFSTPPEEFAEVPIVRATRLMLERAQDNGGLSLTKGGSLSRADVTPCSMPQPGQTSTRLPSWPPTKS